MTSIESAFDPSRSKLFDRDFMGSQKWAKANITRSWYLFYLLNQPGNAQTTTPIAYNFIVQGLREARQSFSELYIRNCHKTPSAALKVISVDALPEKYLTQDSLSQVLNQITSILLTQPCWLHNISQTSSCQTETAVNLMDIYLQLTRSGHGRADLMDLSRSMFLATGNGIPALHSYSYCRQSDTFPEMFDFAATQLALKLFPRVLFPEILGFTLAYFQMPTLVEACFPKHQLPSLFFKLRQNRVNKQYNSLNICINNYLNLFPEQKQDLWQRLQNGFWLYHLHMQRCRDKLASVLNNALSPQEAIASLFQDKATAAIGHHQKIMLEGVSLDKWFAGLPGNSQKFLNALKHSGYVNQEKPGESSLVKLFEFNGPMFGVLDQSEMGLLKNWLKDGLNEIQFSTKKSPEQPFVASGKRLNFPSTGNYAKFSNRKLYYFLVNADLYPDVLPNAKNRVHKILSTCSWFNRLPFKHYSHVQFNDYLKNIYQLEISAYKPLQGMPRISKEAYVWGIEQIAPMILIDGCWLQNSLALQDSSPDICEILFKIYCDELGNGCLEHNHPHIFQQLLDSLSIQVPPIHSEEFVQHSRFINSAFDLPVYMLALSNFPADFMPELLGLNMAIEISGLGKGYMKLVDEWTYWGIDPTIANVHIAIDNYASGHTFLAKKAIQLYMDDVLQNTSDRPTLDRHWRRIYNGYASLRFVGTRFRICLPVSYLFKKLKAEMPFR